MKLILLFLSCSSLLFGDSIDYLFEMTPQNLIEFVDSWNGGTSKNEGHDGMGTYHPNWDGLFRMNFNAAFKPVSEFWNPHMTLISQARGIYINAEAYRQATGQEKLRFKQAVQKAADYSIRMAKDAEFEGYFWVLQNEGLGIDSPTPPTTEQSSFGTNPLEKDTYGHAAMMFSLVHAYSVTRDVNHLNSALYLYKILTTHFADTSFSSKYGLPNLGGYLPTFSRDWGQPSETSTQRRNLDYMCHLFEGFIALYDITQEADIPYEIKEDIRARVKEIGDFLLKRCFREVEGHSAQGYFGWYYDENWNIYPEENWSSSGHAFEMAYLLSRAVEKGFNPEWLHYANKLLEFGLKSLDLDISSAMYGAVITDKQDFKGQPIIADHYLIHWWQQAEAARCLIHFIIVRGRVDLIPKYKATYQFITQFFVDSIHGGWHVSLDPSTLLPIEANKGSVWTGGYHEVMLYTEMLRLQKSVKE